MVDLEDAIGGKSGAGTVHVVVRGLTKDQLDTVIGYVNSHATNFIVRTIHYDPRGKWDSFREWRSSLIADRRVVAHCSSQVEPGTVANTIKTYYKLYLSGIYNECSVSVLERLELNA